MRSVPETLEPTEDKYVGCLVSLIGAIFLLLLMVIFGAKVGYDTTKENRNMRDTIWQLRLQVAELEEEIMEE